MSLYQRSKLMTYFSRNFPLSTQLHQGRHLVKYSGRRKGKEFFMVIILHFPPYSLSLIVVVIGFIVRSSLDPEHRENRFSYRTTSMISLWIVILLLARSGDRLIHCAGRYLHCVRTLCVWYAVFSLACMCCFNFIRGPCLQKF